MKFVNVKGAEKLPAWLNEKGGILAVALSKVAINSIQDSIKEKKAVVTGELLRSWTFEIAKQSKYSYVSRISSSAPYWKAVDEGSKGSFTPIPSLIEWIKEKGKKGFPVPDTESDIERLAYAISLTHAKSGIEARRYLELAITKFNSRKNIVIYNWTQKYMGKA